MGSRPLRGETRERLPNCAVCRSSGCLGAWHRRGPEKPYITDCKDLCRTVVYCVLWSGFAYQATRTHAAAEEAKVLKDTLIHTQNSLRMDSD
ncbi:hypothetical protein NDU88_006062 [Pleurodeles waltl]|uniref:Uncharacterized protein n=1 Tax=Pleurodeles waltl TaxID=8319 RepID=A0AAV7QHY1_PLEWA|nr:hypothetical protein NDU88_006062 [Pleurodeles waltl]